MGKKTIDRRWLPLNALRAFEGVAKHGSFTAAAHALLISQSALSRHVISLERLIGVQLFERRPHALTLTKAGQHLLPAVAKSFDRLEYAIDDIRNEGAPAQRTLRVRKPPSVAVQLAVPILRDFRQAGTEVDIDLICPAAAGPPLGDVDVAVVYSRPMVTDLVADLLWPVRVSILCHPDIAGQHLLPAVVKSFDRLEYALDDIRNEGAPAQRTLRVQMPPSFAVQLAVPILRDFHRLCADVDIDLVSPHGVGPPLGDVDVAVIYSRPTVTDLVTDLLWSERLSILCSPGIAAAARHGKDLAAFIEANEIVHIRLADQPRHFLWLQFARQSGLSVDVERGLVVDTAVLAAQYALRGQGIALADPTLFAEELASGALVKPFDAAFDAGYGYYRTTPPEELGDSAIALFRSWLIERFGTRNSVSQPPVQLAVSNE
ncbi:MAG: LysR substrate-binding domain-containing protein [Steroidobacteraceae bacterium]